MSSIRILIVEDDPVWKNNTYDHLSNEDDIDIIGCTGNKEEALEHLKNADVVVISDDIRGIEQHGIKITVEINQIKPVKIILLVELMCRETILEAFCAGVVQCVPKSSLSNLSHVIRSVMQIGASHKILIDEYARLNRVVILQQLTPSEREILEMLEQGFNQITIAQTLHKAKSTIKNQVRSILKKMNVRTTKQAVRLITHIFNEKPDQPLQP